MAETYVAATRTDGSVAHIAVQLTGRFPRAPSIGGWRLLAGNTYGREDSDEVVAGEVQRFSDMWARGGDPAVVSWRRISQAEHEMFERDRVYRDALEDSAGQIQHNMVKARELHRALIRHKNGDRFMTLDREWVDASASGKKSEADAVEAKRKLLREFPDDPRIDAAQTLDELKVLLPPDV